MQCLFSRPMGAARPVSVGYSHDDQSDARLQVTWPLTMLLFALTMPIQYYTPPKPHFSTWVSIVRQINIICNQKVSKKIPERRIYTSIFASDSQPQIYIYSIAGCVTGQSHNSEGCHLSLIHISEPTRPY